MGNREENATFATCYSFHSIYNVYFPYENFDSIQEKKYAFVPVCVCVCWREREREREGDHE